MDVTLTTNCNNNCCFCPRHTYLKTVACKTSEDRYNDIKNTRKTTDKIVLSGGEITILKELWKIIDFCKKINFKEICVITNARRLKDYDFAKRMVLSGVKDFAVSLYSTDEKVHDSITRSKGSCKETKQGIVNLLRLASDHDINLRVNFVLNYWNIKDLSDTLNEVFNWGVENFILAEQIIVGNKSEHLILKEIIGFLDDIRKIDLKGVRICLRGFPLCLFKRDKPIYERECVVKYKNPFIVLEKQNVDTLVKESRQKIKYLLEFKKLFTFTAKCNNCFYKQHCLGIQKAYL